MNTSTFLALVKARDDLARSQLQLENLRRVKHLNLYDMKVYDQAEGAVKQALTHLWDLQCMTEVRL